MHNRTQYQYLLEERNGENWRSWKRGMRKIGMNDPVEVAYNLGQYDGYFSRKQRHRYPPGKRADAYRAGYMQRWPEKE